MMTIERFKVLVEAYGANPARWPEAERAVAEAFANATPEAQRVLAESSALDRLLDAAPTAPVTRELEMRVLDGFAARKDRRIPWLPDVMPWTQAAALAASLVLGMLAGGALPALAGIGETSAAVEPAVLAFGDFDAEFLEDAGDGT